MTDETNPNGGKWPTPHRRPLSWYCELQDRIRARSLASMKNWPAPDSIFELGDQKMTPRWAFGHVIQHESYHGGQIVLLNQLWNSRG